MPRRPRLKLAGIPHHVIQRGNNRSACFFDDEDYQYYLDYLSNACRRHDVALHAYVLMTNHTHLLMTPKDGDGPSRVMKELGQRYVQYINRTYGRSGTLWEGRFRSCLVDENTYFFSCHRYIELNPVRAGMVEHPRDYPWSSYRRNAQCDVSKLISPHPLYIKLGNDHEAQCSAYREFFRFELDPGVIDQIRSSTNGGYVLGSEQFQHEVAKILGRRTWRGLPGRPSKEDG